MTNSERQQLKADLIKGRFWSASNLADPTIDKYAEAIGLAAIALPDFLKQHPECAAD